MSLEEDMSEEFRGGGSMRINKSAEQQSASSSGIRESYRENKAGLGKTDSVSSAGNSGYYWSGLPLPLTSISNKITETLWSSKRRESMQVQDAAHKPIIQDKPPTMASTSSVATTTHQSVLHQPTPPPPSVPPQTSGLYNQKFNFDFDLDAKKFFTYRDGVAERAASECATEFLDMETEGPVIGSYLLTQINHWDTDKERLILLTPKILLMVKYDFIALKRLSYKKLPLEDIEAIIIGDLVYPSGSLIPKINGLADGISSLWENCFFKVPSNDNQQFQTFSSPTRDRNMKGIRILFGKGQPIKLASKWNPFTEDLPIWTLTFHPLYFHRNCKEENIRRLYDLEHFIENFCRTIIEIHKSYETRILHSNVLLENYIGFGAIIHNRNDLGFFKVRGKFSF